MVVSAYKQRRVKRLAKRAEKSVDQAVSITENLELTYSDAPPPPDDPPPDDPPPDDPPPPVAGWTEFTESADTRKVYVSSSGGNDNNGGLSEGDRLRSPP
ncbi:MAG: hypothetical protein ACYTDY_20055 [Planctomycetota bacterium]|jgi:hypothetical protein